MASILRVDKPSGELDYFRIQIRGRGKSPASVRWRVPEGAVWSQRKIDSEVRKFAAQFEEKVHSGQPVTREQKKQAAEAEAAAQAEAERKNVSFRNFYENVFLPAKKREIVSSTVQSYNSLFSNYVLPAFGDIPIKEITSSDIRAFQNKMLESCAVITVNHRMKKVSCVFEMAVELEVIESNPCNRVSSIKEDKETTANRIMEKENLVRDESLKKIVDYLENENLFWKCFGFTALDSGCRVGELLGLEWDNITFCDDGTALLRIEKTVTLAGEIISPKTSNSIRVVDVGEKVAELLGQLKSEAKENRSFVFTCLKDTPIAYSTVSTFFRRLSKKVGFRVTAHSMRHISSSLQVAAGVPLSVISKRNGHSMQTLLTTYVHAGEDRGRGGASARKLLASISGTSL